MQFMRRGASGTSHATFWKTQEALMPGNELWEIDSARSQLTFSLRHIVVSEIHGRFTRWGGQMSFDPDDVDRSRIRLWIDVDSIDTGSDERDAHLRSAEFLDVARHPRAEFTGTGVTIRRDGQALLRGLLRLHGITRNVDLEVQSDRTWIDDSGRLHATYQVRGRLDRQAFGLHWNQDLDVGGVVVGDKVDIDARVEMVRTATASFARPDPPDAKAAMGDQA
jgi:polyisoprenoid-binding protein YceI